MRARRGGQAHGLGAEASPRKSLNGRDPMQMAHERARRAADAAASRPPSAAPRPARRPRHPADGSGVPTPMTAAACASPPCPAARRSPAPWGSASPSSSSAARPSPPPTATSPSRKLVVVICRGGMDGLSVSPPVGDPQLRGPARRDRHPRLRPARRRAEARRHLRPAPLARGGARAGAEGRGADRAGRRHARPRPLATSRRRTCWRTARPRAYGTDSGWLNRALQAHGRPAR